MEIRKFRSKSSDIKSQDQLLRYYDYELFLDFESIDKEYFPLAFGELATTVSATSSLFRANEIFSLTSFSSSDRFFVCDRNSGQSGYFNGTNQPLIRIGLEQLPLNTDIGQVFYQKRTWGVVDRECITDFSSDAMAGEPATSLRRQYGRDVHLSRSPIAIRRILRYWQIVKYVERLYPNPEKFVRSSSRVPSFEVLMEPLSFERYKDKALDTHYPFLKDKNRGRIPDALAENISNYVEDLKEMYASDVINPFTRINDALGEVIVNFIHDECDDHLINVVVDDKGVFIRRGVDRKTLPYFNKLFEEQDDKTIISIFC